MFPGVSFFYHILYSFHNALRGWVSSLPAASTIWAQESQSCIAPSLCDTWPLQMSLASSSATSRMPPCPVHYDCISALQEILPQWEMKQQYSKPSATKLDQYLDLFCLHGLLLGHNPNCGRWTHEAVPARPSSEKDENEAAGDPHPAIGIVPQPQPVQTGSSTRKKLVLRMKIGSHCRSAKYCIKLCQVFDMITADI
uniref:Uncharacterized protein n=1 Tax=Corethron hystrix TaxID=216773 RepID=A0A7S1BHM5_9STRA|mmetsp:Transcript_28278/g.64685  ORF Transcript_28278/g.64685 Transcript_28278/m.64685 type:complete len:197 (+) Transcript_28278:225-815(+)